MTQNTEQHVRTRDEQVETLAFEIALWGKSNLHERRAVAEKNLKEAEARGAAEQRRKDAEGCERWEFEEPEYHDQGMGCGLEDRGIHDRYQAMEYGWEQAVERCIERIPEELYARPANVAALEARVKVLEGVCRHVVWTEEEHGLGSRGHDSAVQAARAALTRIG